MESSVASTPRVLHLSLVVGDELRDRSGAKLGRVDDLIVRLGEDEYPPVTGLLATVAGRQVFVAADEVDEIDHRRVTLRGMRLDLQPFRRRSQEVLLKKDVLDRQLINVDGARLVRSNDIEIARLGGWYRVVGVDVGLRGLLRRLAPRALAGSIGSSEFLDWALVEPFTGHVPTVRLRVPHPKLARLHPAQLADLVEAATHREGEGIIEAVGDDPDLQADVFEELESHHQLEFLEERSDEQVAEVLARMESDDAADLVAELPEERREDVVEMLPAVQRRRVRALLGYDAATAGGLMSPDFVCVYSQATHSEVLERVRVSHGSAEALAWIYVMNTHKRLTGAVALADLLRADRELRIGEIAGLPQHVRVRGRRRPGDADAPRRRPLLPPDRAVRGRRVPRTPRRRSGTPATRGHDGDKWTGQRPSRSRFVRTAPAGLHPRRDARRRGRLLSVGRSPTRRPRPTRPR